MKIYKKTTSNNEKRIQLFGLILYKKNCSGEEITRRFLYIFKTKTNARTKKIYFLNINFWTIKKAQDNTAAILREINRVFYNTQVLSQTMYYHSNVFPKYKFINKDKDVVLFACGPSALKYVPIKNSINVGVNGAVKFDNIELDYLFLTDLLKGNPGLNDAIDNYDKHGKCKKFYALLPQKRNDIMQSFDNAGRIPQRHFFNSGATPFLLEDVAVNKWAVELACEPFGDFGGSVFSALQFICYTYPKRIFLVGCDCTNGYFYKTNYDGDNSCKIRNFLKFKKFQEEFYPDIEVYSINPVGLKGIFKDVYTNDKGQYVTESGEILNMEEELLI